MKPLSKKLLGVLPSPTLALAKQVKVLTSKGISVIDFGVGEPNVDVFSHIKAAGIKSIQDNHSRYTPVAGIMPLREAIATKLKDDNDLHYDASHILVSTGAKQALANCIAAITNPGDEVIIVEPYWVSYVDMVRLAGAEPVIASTDHNFVVTASRIAEKVTSRTVAIILNYPCNPTGATMLREELERIASLAQKRDLWIISDEIYEYLTYEGKHTSIASLSADIFSRTITINGFSKAYAMTGLRVGYAAGPREVIALAETLQSQVTSGACSIAQDMALAALATPHTQEHALIEAFKQKRDLCMQMLHESGLPCSKPHGAFYVFPSIKSTGFSSTEFAAALLEEEHVAVVPGNAFGSDEHIRISFATSEENMREGFSRIKRFVEKTQNKER